MKDIENKDPQNPEIKTEIKTEEEELRGKTGGFHCGECSAHFFYEEYFLEHIREHHLPTKGGKQVGSRIILTDTSSNKKISSSHCEPKETILEDGDDSQHSTQSCNSVINLVTDQPYKCSECPYATRQINNLRKHERIHMLGHSKKKYFRCSDCSYATEQQSHLMTHRLIHTKSKPFQCSECGYIARRKGDLVKHKLTHIVNKKPFACSICSYAARKEIHLKNHEKIHTNPKPFKCSECSFATKRKGDFTRHQLIHSNEKPFKCSKCSYAARRKENLEKHNLIHSSEKPFKCSECSYATRQKVNLKKHQHIHSNESASNVTIGLILPTGSKCDITKHYMI